MQNRHQKQSGGSCCAQKTTRFGDQQRFHYQACRAPTLSRIVPNGLLEQAHEQTQPTQSVSEKKPRFHQTF